MKTMRTFVKPLTFLMMSSTGWGNGYVVIPKGHKLHGKDYDNIDVDVHGGLTFAANSDELDWEELIEEDKGGYVVGFDCAHAGDNSENCPKRYVEKEAENLKEQLEKL